MNITFNKNFIFLAIVFMLLLAANGNAGEPPNDSANSSWMHGHKAPATQLVSINRWGTDSGETFSTDHSLNSNGRFVAFESFSRDLVAYDIKHLPGLFVRDLKTGTTTLVSIFRAGTGPSVSSGIYQLSADGRFIVFNSEESDLVANDNNGLEDTFVRDLKTGTTQLVSINRTGTASGNGTASGWVALSSDARFVLFNSRASDLVANDKNVTSDVFVRDLKTGKTVLVNVNSAGVASSRGGSSNLLSAYGRFVAFDSRSSELVANDGNGFEGDVFVRDLKRGKTSLVSVNSSGMASGNGASGGYAISANGRFVLFNSLASNLVANDNNGQQDLFLRDLKAGKTMLVSVNSSGTGSGNEYSGGSANLSANGRFVAFSSWAGDLVANDNNGIPDIFVRDMTTGKTTLVSVNSTGTSGGNEGAGGTSISADGRFVVFNSRSSDLVANDKNDKSDIFVRDLKMGTTRLVSVNRAGTDVGNDSSGEGILSSDGRGVAFRSEASDLVKKDTNGTTDVFARIIRPEHGKAK